MPIPLSCRCGSSFEARDDQAGQSAYCPQCGVKHFVPTPESLVPEPAAAKPRAAPAKPASTPSSRNAATTQTMYPCVVCKCRFLKSQVYDDDGEIICRDCWDREENGGGSSAQTGLQVRTWFFPLFWTMMMYQPELRIDGKKHRINWHQTKFIPLKPGKYDVEMTVHMLFGPMGTQRRTVTVKGDRIKLVEYQHYSFWATMDVRNL
jgi:DNA-directed RNA polymerase subunit RPC12/RpoP